MIRVLAKPKTGPSNPRNGLMYQAIETDFAGRVSIDPFSAGRVLRGGYDVFHMHWPDRIFAGSNLVAVIKLISLAVMLLLFRARGTRIMWTVHNPVIKHRQVHPVLLRRYYILMRSLVTHFVYPSSASRRAFEAVFERLSLGQPSGAQTQIPLGLQVELQSEGLSFPADLDPDTHDYLLIVGRISDDKFLDKTIADLSPVLQEQSLHLIVAGKPKGKKMEALAARIANDPNITVLPRFLTNPEVNALIAKARSVVIDYPVTNSGVATLAAALGTPIVFSDQQMAQDFATDYGFPHSHALRDDKGLIDWKPENGQAAASADWDASAMSMRDIGRRYAEMYIKISDR
ncbi:glycosyltransferase [Yoonia sp. SS1-5]|uniref:Glycosyltransferase n=1 Tax=Yoonia rhodophyticola TaxID=3137370 RepID=A0AAN0ME70_9RHOB